MKNTRAGANSKPKYVKPKLRTIKLTAQEVLGAGCKAASTGGQLATKCYDALIGLNCNQPGS